MNQLNNSILWWALNFTSKNPLISKLFKDLLIIINNVQNLVKDNHGTKTTKSNNIIHKVIIDKYFEIDSKQKFELYFLSKFIINFLKSIILLFSSYIFTLFSKNKNLDSEILIFSFVDSRSRGNTDTYFGDLIDKIKLEYPHYNISYLFYAYRPYFSNIKNLFEEKNFIYSYLKF